MADETISTRIVANADFSALIADVHKVTASLSKLQEQLANSNKMLANNVALMNRNFADTLRSTGQYSTHFVSLTSDVEKFGKNLDGGRLKLRDYFGTFQSHVKTSGGLIRELARQQVAMQNAILQPLGRNAQGLQQFNVHIPRGLDEIKSKTSIARQELAIMNKVIQDGAVQLINWGKNTQWAGRQLTVGLSLPLAAFGKASADAFRQADQELTRLTKVYGDIAGTTSAELGKVRQDVIATSKELSQAYGTNFNETISLAADIAATGKKGQELLDSVKETSRLAVLGEVDRQEAMKATLAIQTAFQQNTDELSQSINFLNAVENQTSTSLADLVEAIPKAGPVVKQLGGDIQDLALYMTAMREGGINASEGANALKSGLAALINPTKQTVGVMADFGIDILSMVKKNAGDTTSLLFDLQAALDNLDPLQKAQAIEQMFGKFQFARISALLNNLGRQGSQTLQVLDLMKASTSDLERVAGRELAAVTESASGRYKRAIESLKADLAGLGDQFLSIATTMINVVDKALKFFEGLPKPIKSAITFLGALTALAGPLIMITGVLANFFGYILKGVMHMKAFFKGGEGWKYLTPEMLAAEKAGKLVEASFYSDAKAASVLQLALRNLIDEFSILEAKAKSGSMAVNPVVTTMAGNLVMGAGGREVVAGHPLAGAMGTRASTHMVPRSGLTDEQRMQQTIFGFVPGSIPVNRKIGDAPQIYMNDPLPPVPGLTQIGGVSTGVVSGEAARWHSMMATLAMQSKAEIEALKKQIATTGVVSKDFMMQFDDILPIVSKITNNAARESSLIVSELRAGKLTVEQAKAQIIALNLEVERMIGAAVAGQAATMGRTINPTMVPTLNQPVVDPTGKSNMRELFKKSKTRDLINKVARSVGVRTSGAGYNIETTRPKKFASGDLVPGSGNQDTVPAMLTPGEFVVNKSATAANLPLLMAINGGAGSDGLNKIRGGSVVDRVTASLMQLFGRASSSPMSPQRGHVAPHEQSLLMWLTRRVNQNTRSNSLVGMSGMEIAQDLEMLRTQGLHPMDLIHESALRLGYSLTGEDKDRIYEKLISELQDPKRAGSVVFGGRGNPALEEAISTTLRPELQALRNPASQFPSYYDEVTDLKTERGRVGSHARRSIGFISSSGRSIRTLPRGVRSILSTATGGSKLSRIRFSLANLSPRSRMLPIFKSSGGFINMNSGGMVPGVQYANRGKLIPALKSGFKEGKESGPSQIGTGPASQMMGMGLLFGGQMVGGSVGQGMQVAGMLASFLPMLTPLGKMIKGMGSLTGTITKFGSIAGRVFIAVRTGITAMLGPVGLAIAGVTALAAIIIKMKKDAAENKRDQESMFGISKKSADELGIKYTNLSDRMKEVREEHKLAADKAKAYFESYTSSGVTGLTLTIQQLRELKERVKTDMPETMAILNNIDSSKVNEWASNLKAQMVASGKSVEEATNLIYALIESSNKAGMGVRAISDKAFSAISDKGSAADFIIKNLAENIQSLSTIEPSAFASNIDTAISSLDAAVQGLIGTKDATGDTIDEAEALTMQYERMAKAGVKNRELGAETLKVLKSQRPELAGILNQADTIGGMYAKWRLYLQGVNLDLKSLTSAQAETLSTFMANLDKAGDAALTVGGGVEGLEDAAILLKELNKQYKAANAAATADIDTKGLTKEKIAAIQKEIKLIRERAEAKKKALKDAFDSENTELEMQKLQLEYQQALARGDKDAAAQAQISIQQLSKQYQLQKAMDKIDENAKKEEAKQQGILDADAAYKGKLQDAANNSASLAKKLEGQIKNITDIGKSLTDVAAKKTIAESTGSKTDLDAYTIAFNNVLRDIATSASKDKKVFDAYKQYLSRTDTGKKDSKGNIIYDYKKDDKGNYVPGDITQYNYETGYGLTTTAGSAAQELSKLQGSMNNFAITLMGKDKRDLTHIYDLLNKAQNKDAVKVSQADIKSNESALSFADKKAIIDKYDLVKDDTFVTPGGYTYRVDRGHDAKGLNVKGDSATRMAIGGYIRRADSGVSGVMGTQPYLVGERGPELFIPSGGGQIIPNNMLGINYGPSFNIPSNTVSGVSGGANNSYNNNVYNIDIDLNGTNVTADDIMRRFKAELALIGAKEGRVRTVGGTY